MIARSTKAAGGSNTRSSESSASMFRSVSLTVFAPLWSTEGQHRTHGTSRERREPTWTPEVLATGFRSLTIVCEAAV